MKADTSLQAYLDNKVSLEGDKETVYNLLKENGPMTQEQVAQQMGKYPNQVSGRFTELEDENLIEVVSITVNSRGNQVQEYDIKEVR